MGIDFDVVAAQAELKQTGRYMAKLFGVSEGMWSKIRRGDRWPDGVPDEKSDIVNFLQEKLGHNGAKHPAADAIDEQPVFSDTESEPEARTTSDDADPQGTPHPTADDSADIDDEAYAAMADDMHDGDDDGLVDIDALVAGIGAWADAFTDQPTHGDVDKQIMALVEADATRSVCDALYDILSEKWPKKFRRKTLESDWAREERALKAEQKAAEQQPTDTGDWEEKPPTEVERKAEYERLRDQVTTIAESENILNDAAELLHARGLAGESDAIRLIYLGATARVLLEPIHPLLAGPSGGGKSRTADDTLQLFPPEDVLFMTTMSPKALFYRPGHFEHRVLYIAEASLLENDDNNTLAAVVRELQTRGEIVHEVVVDDPDAPHGRRTETIERKGPTTLVLTTTATTLHSENETRMLRLHITETAEHTKSVFKEMGRAAAGAIDVGDGSDIEEWQDFQRWIGAGPRRVRIPFAEALMGEIPASAVSMRRSAGHMIQLIRAHALLHQANREIVDGEVIATLDDYEAIRTIMAKAMAESIGDAPTEAVRSLVDHVVAKLSASGDGADDSDTKPNPRRAVKGHVTFGADKTKVYVVSSRGLAKELKVDHSAARRTLKRAIEDGYLVNEEMRKNHPASLVLGGRELGSYDTNTFLPSAKKVRGMLNEEVQIDS